MRVSRILQTIYLNARRSEHSLLPSSSFLPRLSESESNLVAGVAVVRSQRFFSERRREKFEKKCQIFKADDDGFEGKAHCCVNCA